MKITLKKVCAAVMLLAIAGSAFAEGSFASMPKYVKGSLGYGYSQAEVDYELDYYLGKQTLTYSAVFNYFMVQAAFGVMPWTKSDNVFLKGLAVEGACDFGFGGNDSFVDSTLIRPGVMAVYSYTFKNGFKGVPFGGVGFSVPIQILSGDYDISDTDIGFTVDLKAGFGYDFTEKLRGAAEYKLSFGTGLGWMLGVGCQYFLGK